MLREPRKQNVEADLITSRIYEWLNPDKRVEASLDKLPFLHVALHTSPDEGAKFYRDLKVVNQVPAPEASKTTRMFRVRDPWD